MANSTAEIQHGTKQGIGPRPLLEDRSQTLKLTTAGGLEFSVAIVADGIGGANAGERAAQLAVDAFVAFCRNSRETNIPNLLKSALEKANADVYEEGKKLRKTHGEMGCTATVAAIHNGRLYIANVGDSRAYLVRGKRVVQLTSDHTWGNEMLLSGKRTAAEVARHPKRDQITRSIGYEPTVLVDLEIAREGQSIASQGMDLLPGDKILVCSDGLIKSRPRGPGAVVSGVEIAEAVNTRAPQQAANELVELAEKHGTDDNVSVAVLAVPGGRTTVVIPPVVRIGLISAGAMLVVVFVGFVCFNTLGRFINPTKILPTPTIPALQNDLAFVSVLSAQAFSQLPSEIERPLIEGDVIRAGKGSLIRVKGKGFLKIGLSDGAFLWLLSDSEIELRQIAGQSGVTDTIVQLNQGRAIVDIHVAPGRHFYLQALNGAVAEVIGSVLGGHYDPDLQVYEADCYAGTCRLRQGSHSINLARGQHAWADSLGQLGGPLDGNTATCHEVPDLCSVDVVPSPTPTWTPVPDVPTPTGTPTATRRPLIILPTFTPTPIPPTLTPQPVDYAATAHCSQLQSLGTPCP